jgi:hypothetical protein
LPTGLSLNATTGLINGIPTALGTFSFTVRLSDSQAPPATLVSNTLRIIIEALPDPPPPPPGGPLTITSAGTLTAGRLNKDYSFQLVATGGTTPYTWALSLGNALPPGLVLNPTTGIISGKPVTTGFFTFTVRVTDAAATTVTSSQLSINVTP